MATIQSGKCFAEAHGNKPAAVHDHSIVSHAEEDEHNEANSDLDPSVEKNDTIRWYHHDFPPGFMAVDSIPVIRYILNGSVLIQRKALEGKENHDQGE